MRPTPWRTSAPATPTTPSAACTTVSAPGARVCMAGSMVVCACAVVWAAVCVARALARGGGSPAPAGLGERRQRGAWRQAPPAVPAAAQAAAAQAGAMHASALAGTWALLLTCPPLIYPPTRPQTKRTPKPTPSVPAPPPTEAGSWAGWLLPPKRVRFFVAKALPFIFVHLPTSHCTKRNPLKSGRRPRSM